MADFTEEQLFDMSEEDLEAAFNSAKDTEDFQEEDSVDEDEDLEQPDVEEDSEDDSEEDEGEDETEENSEDKEGELDGEPEVEEEETEEVGVEPEAEAQPTDKEYKFKASGKDYEFTEKEVMEQFPAMFAKAQDYTKKMQTLKPWRKTIDALETAELGHDDINLMIDVLKGDKDAVTEVLKRTGVDALDLDTEKERKYVANDYGRDAGTLELRDAVDSIKNDTEYVTTHKVLSSDWDDASWNVMSKNPNLVKALHVDVKSGRYKQIQPIAEKLKMFGNGDKSDLDYYGEAAVEFLAKESASREQKTMDDNASVEAQRVSKVKADSVARKATQTASKKRKAASIPKKGTATKKVTDYLDASDDDSYEEWAKKVENDN